MRGIEGLSALDTNEKQDAAVIGPTVIQGFLQYLFQGVIITQAIKFYDRREEDPMTLRIYVLLLVLCSVVQTGVASGRVWLETVDVARTIHPLQAIEPLCNAIICNLCEAYLIRRCYKATGSKLWVLSILVGLSTTSFVAAIILTVKAVGDIGTKAHLLHTSSFAYPLWVYGQVITTASLTAILSVYLWRTRTGLPYLDRTVAHIIFLIWETASLPALCILVSGIIYCIRDAQGINGHSVVARSRLDLFFAILGGKLFVFGLLRTLNSRTKFRERLRSRSLGRRSLSGWQWSDGNENSAGSVSGRESTLRGSVPEGRKDSGKTECGAGMVSAGEPVGSFRPPSEADVVSAVQSGSIVGKSPMSPKTIPILRRPSQHPEPEDLV